MRILAIIIAFSVLNFIAINDVLAIKLDISNFYQGNDYIKFNYKLSNDTKDDLWFCNKVVSCRDCGNNQEYEIKFNISEKIITIRKAYVLNRYEIFIGRYPASEYRKLSKDESYLGEIYVNLPITEVFYFHNPSESNLNSIEFNADSIIFEIGIIPHNSISNSNML